MDRYLLVLLVLVVCHTALSEDLYKVLGVSRGARTAEIRRAYRQLAKEWHPDKNREQHAQEKFIEISRAYEILGDEQKRQKYDHFGTVDDQDRHFRFDKEFLRNHRQFQQFFMFNGRPHAFVRPQQPPSLYSTNNLLFVLLPLLLFLLLLPAAGQRDGEQAPNRRQRRQARHHGDRGDQGNGEQDEAQPGAESDSPMCTRLEAASFHEFASLPSGHFALVLLVNDDPASGESRQSVELVRTFLESTSAFHRDRRYHFMYLVLADHAEWLQELAHAVHSNAGEITPSKPLDDLYPGTVLAFNSLRLYLSVFKPQDVPRTQSPDKDDSDDDFLGLNAPDWQAGLMSQTAQDAIAERTANDLRSRLPIWLDRHSDGSVTRLRANHQWPVMTSQDS